LEESRGLPTTRKRRLVDAAHPVDGDLFDQELVVVVVPGRMSVARAGLM
jgi:hypothetical protein